MADMDMEVIPSPGNPPAVPGTTTPGATAAPPPVTGMPPGFPQLPNLTPNQQSMADMIHRIAVEQGVDPELAKRVALTESSLDPSKVGALGERGLMQVRPSTGAQYGAKNLDDPEQTARAGIRYLKYLQGRYGRDDLALAAYNAGPGTIDAAGGRIPFPSTRKYVGTILGRQVGQPQRAAPEAYGSYQTQPTDLEPTGPVIGYKEPQPEAPPAGSADTVSGIVMDVLHSLKIGANMAAEDARTITGNIPVIGKPIVAAMDKVDEWLHGKPSDQVLKQDTEEQQRRLTPQTQAAMDKKWWDPEHNMPGPAWLDWRSYMGGVTQSIPEEVLTMFPAMRVGKAMAATTYAKAMAKGGVDKLVAQEAAARAAAQASGVGMDLISAVQRRAAIASTTKAAADAAERVGTTAAGVTGGALEGAAQGAQSQRAVHDDIMNMSQDTLDSSDAYKALVAQGLSKDDARKQLADDLASQAFVLAGVATGIFSGMGDKILAKAAYGHLGKTRIGSAVKGATTEGLLEEFPQNYLSQVAQNYTEGKADRSIPLTKDAMEQGMQGLGVGSFQGGIMGGTIHHEGAEKPAAAPIQNPTNVSQGAQPSATQATPPSSAGTPPPAAGISATPGIPGAPGAVPQNAPQAPTATTPPASHPALVMGAPTKFSTEQGMQLHARWGLVSAFDLVASHTPGLDVDPRYPAELQPRDRGRAASELQVSHIANNLQPALLAHSELASMGAPIIGPDLAVESGNGRAIALQRAYQQGNANAYQQYLEANAPQFGLTPEQVAAVPNPVLVRLRDTPVDRAEFARQANAAPVAQMSDAEMAKADAERIGNLDDFRPGENGELDTASNRPFIQRFVRNLPDSERGRMIDGDGGLSQSGLRRIQNAVIAKAYGVNNATLRMIESLDNNVRNVTSGMLKAAPRMAQMRDAIQHGQLHDRDLVPHLAEAVDEFSKLRAQGKSVNQLLAQGDMFGLTIKKTSLEVMQFLEENSRSPNTIRDFLERYSELLHQRGNPKQASILDSEEVPTSEQLISQAISDVSRRGKTDGGLFEGKEAPAGPATGGAGKAEGGGAEGVPGNLPAGQDGERQPRGGGDGAESHGAKPGPDRAAGGKGKQAADELKRAKAEKEAQPEPSQPEGPRLPPELAKATPKYGYQGRNFKLAFGSDLALAGYIIAAPMVKSKQDGAYLDFVMKHTGLDEDGARAWGAKVRAYIKGLAKDAPTHQDTLIVPPAAVPLPTPEKATAAPELTPEQQADKDIQDALGDLGDWVRQNLGGAKNITPEQGKATLLPILTRLFDAAFRKGYIEFKKAARFVLDTIKGHPATKELAPHLTLKQLQGAYIGMDREGSEGHEQVFAVKSLDELAQGGKSAVERYNELLPEWNAAVDAKDKATLDRMRPTMDALKAEARQEQDREFWKKQKELEGRQKQEAEKTYGAMPVGTKVQMSGYDKDSYWLKVAPNKWERAFNSKPDGVFKTDAEMHGNPIEDAATVDAAAHGAATSPQNDKPAPTQGQIEAGNYEKGHVRIAGLDISIENPEGSTRSGVDSSGNPWSVTLHDHYGYILGTEGKDGDHLDVFIKPGTPESWSGPVWVIDQKKPGNGHFDEHKIMLGYATEYEARGAYERNFTPGWNGLRAVTRMSVDELKSWIKRNPNTEPAATSAPEAPAQVDGKVKASLRVAASVREHLKSEMPLSKKDLIAIADREFGGTMGEGVYTVKDMTDAMELGVNQYLDTFARGMRSSSLRDAKAVVQKLEALTELLPTQTNRTQEQDEFQQFSTPPAYAFLVSWVADMRSNDRVLEPSAGIGGLAIFAAGTVGKDRVVVNELSPRRAGLLKTLGFGRVFQENGEQINNILPDDVKPTIVLMNPPFSATAGRIEGQRDAANGLRHIEEALERLEPGGRLVAIMGDMEGNKWRSWYKRIDGNYNIRADIAVSGAGYRKYGITFDVRYLVIDKVPPTASTIKGEADTVSDALSMLEGIRNDRPQSGELAQGSTGSGRDAAGTGVSPSAETGAGGGSGRPVHPRPDGVGGERGADGQLDAGRPHEGQGTPGVVDGAGGGRTDEVGPGSAPEHAGRGTGDHGAGAAVEGQPAGGGGIPADRTVEPGSQLDVQAHQQERNPGDEITDAVFDPYKPQKLKIPGASEHPGKLVESAAMATVEPPDPTYKPNLPTDITGRTDGKGLSLVQLEPVVYAGQAHSVFLKDGSRMGFFIGDGTGVGKGREISGIILDNWRQGRKKAVWISEKSGLLDAARRDMEDALGDPKTVFPLAGTNYEPLKQGQGVMFTTYATLRSSAKKGENGKPGKTRLQQIAEWLGPDFDGVIAFDEAHNMGNAVAIGGNKPAAQALAGIALQNMLPKARVIYVSATGATEVQNLAYATRLGLWGPGTPFSNVEDFVGKVESGGLAAMELVARDLKQMGLYLARSLSYDDVTYGRLEHQLSPLQNQIYDELANAWQIVLQNINAALNLTDGKKNNQQRSNAYSQFWGAHQRFFNQIITSMQMPTILEQAQKDLDAGNSIVMQLVNTNEASQARALKNVKDEEELEELDLTPREQLTEYIKTGFPVTQFQPEMGPGGKVIFVPAVDSQGNFVINRAAVKMRDELLAKLAQIRVPSGPLEQLLGHFGTDNVAEITGRKQRVVRVVENGQEKTVVQKRGEAVVKADSADFLAGKKRVLVFSDAGGTGFSFHADLTKKNQQHRMHYLVQPGWRADKAVQGFGRTHRSNAASSPHYYLCTTDLKAQKRFISSVARRLDQLGALTKGQRQTGSQGMFNAQDNLESQQARDAVFWLFKNRMLTSEEFAAMGFDMAAMSDPKSGTVINGKIPTVPQFLNRLLSLTKEQQETVFDKFSVEWNKQIDQAAASGRLDVGMETLRALHTKIIGDQVAHTDERTGAKTRYVELELTHKTVLAPFPGSRQGITYWKQNKSGRVWSLRSAGTVTTKEGAVEERFILAGPGSQKYIAKAEFQQNQYTPLTPQEAAPLWEAENQARPKTYTEIVPMISGLTLPIWDRLPEYARVGRAQADDGQRVLGRIISKGDVPDVLRRLGLTSSVAKLPAESVFRMVKDEGQVGELVNAWTIKRSRVGNEWRVELSPRNRYISPAMQVELNRYGLFIERIAYEERAFIPSPNALAKLLEVRPLADIKDSKSADRAAEPGPTYTVGEPAGAPNAQQRDLFGFDLAPQQGGRGLPSQRGGPVPGGARGPAAGVAPQAGVQNLGSSASLPVHSNVPGEFLTRTTLIEASHRDLGASQVTTPEHLAKAMAYMARGADERLECVVTDKAGRPIAVVGSFKGAVAAVAVEPSTIVREAFMIDGAAHVWLVHNHPSGQSALSNNDKRINQSLTDAFRGSGIEPHGMMAIGGSTTGAFEWSWVSATGVDKRSGTVQAAAGTPAMRIPSADRSIVQLGNSQTTVDSPDRSREVAKDIAKGRTGVVLLNVANQPVGFMPLNYKEVAKLRTGGRMDAIYRALSVSNAFAAVINVGKLQEPEVKNLAGLLNTAGVMTLDAIEPSGASWAEDGKNGLLVDRAFFSRQPGQRGISLDDLRAEVRRGMAGWRNAPEVVTVQNEGELPREVRRQITDTRSSGLVAGAFHDGKVYLVADNIRDPNHAQFVVLHEVVGHYGLRGILGAELQPVLMQLWKDNASIQLEAAKLMGRYSDLSRVEAVEEVLSDMAGRGVRANLVQKVIAAIRAGLRKLGLNLKMSDSDVLALLAQSRQFVERGRAAGMYGGRPAFSAAPADLATRQIEQWLRGKLDRGAVINLGHPSEVLQSFGMPDQPITLRQSILTKARAAGRDIPARDLLRLPDTVLRPIAVFSSTHGPGHLVLVTELSHAHGNLVAAVDLQSSSGNVQVSSITSIHPREGASIATWLRDGRLLGYEKTKGRTWLEASAGYNSRRDPVMAALTKARVYENPPAVKPSFSRDTSVPTPEAAQEAREKADAILARQHKLAPLEAITRVPVQAMKLDKITGAVYDRLLSTIGGLMPEHVKAGLISDYGIPEAVSDRRAIMFAHIRTQLRQTENYLARLEMLTRAESRTAYQYMTTADAEHLLEQLPPESREVLRELKGVVDKAGQEAVRLGQLSADAFERNRWAYLHRSYMKWDIDRTAEEGEARARAIRVLGEQYRGRGMAEGVKMRQIQNVAPGWWGRKLAGGEADKRLKGYRFIRFERRANRGEGVGTLPGVEHSNQLGRVLEVHYWPAEEPVPQKYEAWHREGVWEARGVKGDEAIMWRDFTPEERQRMGEIDEVRYAVAKTMHQMMHDLEVGRYLEWVASQYARPEKDGLDVVEATEHLSTAYVPGTWVQVPSSTLPGTNTKKYGALAGLYVPGPIWNDIRQTVNSRYQPFGPTFNKILQAWKVSKTALSPAVHMNNIMANCVMADWHDVTAAHVLDALGVLARPNDPAHRLIIQRFEDASGTQGMYSLSELQRQQLAPLIEELRQQARTSGDVEMMPRVGVAIQHLMKGRVAAALQEIRGTRAGKAPAWVVSKMMQIYQDEDVIFRLAAFMRAKSEGASDVAAGKVARTSFLDYQINAPWINVMRQTAFPFIAFNYRAIPMMLDVAAHKPWKMLKLAMVLGAVNALGYALSGGNEDKERRLLPEEKAGRTLGFVAPKLLRMPWNDKYDSPVFLDARRFIPVGDIFDMGEAHAAIPILPVALPGGPLTTLAELLFNKSQFTGKPLTLDTDTPAEMANKIVLYLYQTMAPNLIGVPGTYATQGVVNAGRGVTDTFGREQSVPMAAVSSVGLKLGAYPADVAQRDLAMHMHAQLEEINKNIGSLRRQYARRGLDDAEFTSKVLAQREKEMAVRREFAAKVAP